MIHRHYQQIQGSQRPETPIDPESVRLRVIIPIAALNLPARQALAFAQGMTDPSAVTAVYVTDKPEEAAELRAEWERSPHGFARLVILESPYRELASPLLAYVDLEKETHSHDTLVVVLPEFVPEHWWEHLLHNQTALRLKAALLFHPGVIVASVPYHLATPAA